MKGVKLENLTDDVIRIDFSFRQRLTIKWGGGAHGSATGAGVAANGENQYTQWEPRVLFLGPQRAGRNALNESWKRYGQHRKKHFKVNGIRDLTTNEVWPSYSPGEGHFIVKKNDQGVTVVGSKHHSVTGIFFQRARQPSPPPAIPPATPSADPLTRGEEVLVLFAKACRFVGLKVETAYKERPDNDKEKKIAE